MAGHASSLRRAPLLYSFMPLFKLLFASLVQANPINLYAAGSLSTGDMLRKHKDADGGENEASMVLYLSMAAALVLLGGAFAGLTIALMGQDEIYLQVIAESGEDHERKSAQRVLDLLKKGKHWVLVTLLLGNVITNETLPIMLDRSLGGGWQAVVGSTVLIVIFGEIVPQSVCVRFGLPIGSFMAPFVLCLMWILAPIAWPTAKLLDYLLGQDHGTTYKKAGLKSLVTLHRTLNTGGEDRLNKDEVTIISAVLDLKEKPVGSIMTPMEDVFTLSADTILNGDMMDNILSEGYSRIPIYAVDNSNNFIGMLLVKMLITYDPEDGMRVDDFQLATLPETRPETSCLDIVNFFQEGKSHMVLVSESPGEPLGALGVLTLEDVIEELIGEEIIDESDVFVDVHKAIRRLNPAPWFRIPKAALDEDKGDDGSKLISTPVPTHDRKHSLTDGPNTTTKLLRRRSSGVAEPLSMKRQDPQLKNHLKHLGPSNVASRPKMTKINTVKIKPGQAKGVLVTPSQYAASDGGRLEHFRTGSLASESNLEGTISKSDVTEPVVIVDDGNGESTRLLSAGSAAKDGAHVVGYGTLTSSATSKSKNLPEQIRGLSMTGTSPLKDAQSPQSPPPATSERVEDEQATPTPASPKQEAEPSSEDMPRTKLSLSSSSTNHNSYPSTSQASSSPRVRTQESVSTPSFPAKLVISSEAQPDLHTDDEDQNGDENSSGASQVASLRSAGTGGTSRRIARSGSIMERGIDVNGVQKMVLHVNEDEEQSADDGERYTHPRQSIDENEALLGSAHHSQSRNGSSSKDAVDESEVTGSDKRVKKRKKRGGKGKGKHNKKSVASPEASDGVHLA